MDEIITIGKKTANSTLANTDIFVCSFTLAKVIYFLFYCKIATNKKGGMRSMPHTPPPTVAMGASLKID